MDWNTVLDGNKKHHGDQKIINDLAVDVGYLYFTWNDVIYKVSTDPDKAPVDSGFRIEDGGIVQGYNRVRPDA